MIITDARFASAYLVMDATGRLEALAFDDIGDMLIHAAVHPDHDIAAWYVHDYHSGEWLDASSATYVYSEALHTPMAMGLAAHRTAEAAEQHAAELGGEAVPWADLRQRYAMAAPAH